MPHVSLQDGVIRKLLEFVHRMMAITQLTHLHLTVPSSGTISGLVHPDTSPIVPLTRKPVGQNKVSFAENVEVIKPSPPLSPPGEEPNSPDDTSQNARDVITITPTIYELFPFVDPFEDPELLLPPHFPYLPAPLGFVPINRPGEIPAPAGMAARDWSSFIHPAPPSQLSQELPGWAAVDRERIFFGDFAHRSYPVDRVEWHANYRFDGVGYC